MANHNDFKVLQSKCLKMYHFLGVTSAESLTDIKRSRLGFYHFVLENITGVTDVELIKNMIFDAEYNSIVCSIKLDDLGIDAVNIIEHDGINKIQLFNFKYREKFVIKEKTENDISRSTKFLEYMLAESLPKGLNRKIRSVLENIRKRLDSTTVYDLELFMVSNEEGGIASSSEPYVDILKRNYDMRIINISLSELAGFLYANNRNAKASFIVSVKDFLVM